MRSSPHWVGKALAAYVRQLTGLAISERYDGRTYELRGPYPAGLMILAPGGPQS